MGTESAGDLVEGGVTVTHGGTVLWLSDARTLEGSCRPAGAVAAVSNMTILRAELRPAEVVLSREMGGQARALTELTELVAVASLGGGEVRRGHATRVR